jgi:hypothetical protein
VLTCKGVKSSLRFEVTPLASDVLKNVSVSYACRHEIRDQGQTLTGVPTVGVLKNGVISTDLTVTNVQLDATKTKVLFTLSNSAAVPPSTYLLVVSAQFTGGTGKIAGLTCEVLMPSGALLTGCA